MRYACLYIFICLLPRGAMAQTLQGKITDAATGRPMCPVTVINRTRSTATTTSPDGRYVIAGGQGNVMVYSFVGYAAEVREIPSVMMVATIDVAMQRTANELEEFTIRPDKWTKYQRDSAERREIYKVQLRRRPPSPFASPFSALAEKFSKKARRTYAFQKTLQQDEHIFFIDTRYTPPLVQKMTGATADTAAYFMNDCPMPYDFARTATDLELKMWIRSSYREWVKKQK